MRTPKINLKVASPGGQIEAKQWNLIRTAVLTILTERPGLGQSLKGHLPASADMFRIKSSNGDYWTCRRFDGTTEGDTDYLVAKPWELRPSVTTIGSTTFVYATDTTRTATLSAVDEDQTLTPDFVANETIIWAAFADNVGVTAAGVRINWIDLNVAARAWAKSA